MISTLKAFINKENQNLLILKFSDNELNKINSTNCLINNFQKENPKLEEKIIIFIIHMKRQSKNSNIKTVAPDLISFMNDEYYQVFIDNLKGKPNSDIFNVMQMRSNQLVSQYLENNNFIENRIFNILNYMNYTIYYETNDINSKNYTIRITEELIRNNRIKELIKKNINAQGKNIRDIIKDVFITDITEVNNIDFLDVINSKLNEYFCSYLLQIIFYSLRENVLNQIITTKHFDLLMKNDYFNNIIASTFVKTKFNFIPRIKMIENKNKITIYNGLELPKSNYHFDKLIKYFSDELNNRYIENEESLRKNYNMEEKISEVTQNYKKEYDRLEENIKIEMQKYEFFTNIYNQKKDELRQLVLEDYLIYYIIRYMGEEEIDFSKNEKILSFLKLIIKVKLSGNHNHNYNFTYTFEEFIKIILFTQGYKEDIKIILNIFSDLLNYCKNMEDYIINILSEDIIKYEISERNKKYTKIVNISLFNIIESLLRGILLFSIDLLKKDEVSFFEYLKTFILIEANLQKLNRKFYLFNKELYNIRAIIEIKNGYMNNFNNFKKYYEKIVNNLLQQTILIYDDNYYKLYSTILDLIEIIDESFKEKGDDYVNLMFNIYIQKYKIVNSEEIRIKLIEKFFQNKLLVKKSNIFFYETLKDLRPEVYNKNNMLKKSTDVLLNNFMNLTENKKMTKYQNLIKIYNSITSEEFNEILLYFFEGQCQSYFSEILLKYKIEYTEKCCEELISKLSLNYLEKAINYLNLHRNDDNLLKLYAIAYLKTFCYYYVEINYKHFDKCNFGEINKILFDKVEKNEEIRKYINIYIWRLYYQKFENFDQFEKFPFEKYIPIFQELEEKIKLEETKNDNNYIFNESFITKKSKNYYDKLLKGLKDQENKFKFNFDEINNNFDSFYCFLVNKYLSFLYSSKKNIYINNLKNIYYISIDKLNFGEEGKILYKYLLDENLLENKIFKKISGDHINQDEFEILLYSCRFILNTQIKNNKFFYNNILNKTTSNFIKNNYIPRSKDFNANIPVGELHNISYLLLNFILYSYLIGALILDNLTEEEARNYLVENIFPRTLFNIVKNDWALLDLSLKEIGITNIQTFMNIIFDKIIDLMNSFESSNTQDEFDSFEKKINEIIIEALENKDNINNEYQNLNNDLLCIDPHSILEIIKGNFMPSIYKKDYPEIKYYTVSNIININAFVNKFNSSEQNKNRYALINILIDRENDITRNAMKMKSLENINNLVNLLLKIYSYKISREDARKKILKNELKYIKDKYNEINPIKINNEEEIINNYIDPFIKSWDKIKDTSNQYKCRLLRDYEKGEKPLDMKLENALCYFLVDDGDKKGMFLASAYQNYILWQNNFINKILRKNEMTGILNSYKSQIEQEVEVQKATKDEILNIDDNTFKKLNELIVKYSKRNIFGDKNKIDYRKYNDIVYNFDFIEEELGRIILPGIKKFKNDKIKFNTYLFEGFRGGNCTVLADYNTKYIQRGLTEYEKESLNELIKENNNSQFYIDVFTSLQILMNDIIKDNYEQNHLIYKIIEKLPNYIILNGEFTKLLKNRINKNPKDKCFSVNALVSIFEYFEALCWKEIKKNIFLDYQSELPEDAKQKIVEYFNKLTEDKIINKKNFTTALRRLISRNIAGFREEEDIRSDSSLKLYITREDLWSKEIFDNESFDMEIYQICTDEIKIEHCFNLYNVLDGDNILDEELNRNKENKKIKEAKDGIIENKKEDKKVCEKKLINQNDNENNIDEDEEEEDEREDL